MSTVVVITPLIIANWPIITSAVAAAVASMGFSMAKGAAQSHVEAPRKVREEIEVEDSEVLEGAPAEQIVVEREGVRATFTRDSRGGLKLCMEGEGVAKSELRRIGQELLGRVTQQYVYHKVVSELKQRHMSIIDEQVNEDRSVKIRVRVQ